MCGPPAAPQLGPDVRGDLLHQLDQEIQATRVGHDGARGRLQHEQCERGCAATHEPLEEQDQGQFDSAKGNAQSPKIQFQHDCSFGLTGIVPPQPLGWKQVDHLYEDFRKFKRSCGSCVRQS